VKWTWPFPDKPFEGCRAGFYIVRKRHLVSNIKHDSAIMKTIGDPSRNFRETRYLSIPRTPKPFRREGKVVGVRRPEYYHKRLAEFRR